MKTYLHTITVLLIACGFSSAPARATNQKDFAPSFSPSGQQMVYYSYRGQALPDLFISDVDGSNERQLTHTEAVWEIMPKWSPNGQVIVFTAGPNMQDLEIYSINSDGSGLRQLTDGAGKASAAVWHPDGQSIVYSRFNSSQDVDIMTMHLKSEKKHNLTQGQGKKYTDPTWSPDGKMIAYTLSKPNQKSSQMYIADADFKNHKPIGDDQHKPSFFNWAPDSTTLVYSINANGQTNDLFAIDVHTKKITQLTNLKDQHVYFSAFSRNGQHLFMDIGNWSDNFFIYHAYWDGKKVHDHRTQATGQNWVDEIALLEEAFLSPLIGHWRGVTTEGASKGRFEERVHYAWGPNKKSIIVDMELYWDGEHFGTAKGLLGLDWVTKKVYYNLVMDDGTVVMQNQSNAGTADNWEMDVKASGDGSRFPQQFKIKYLRHADGSWETQLFEIKNDEQVPWSTRQFTLVK